MKTIGIIPARRGSKRIPRKALAPIGPEGRPLIDFTLCAATSAQSLDRVALTTDDPKVAAFSATSGVDYIVPRPEGISGDDVSAIEPVLRALDYIEEKEDESFEAVCLLLPTSPFRTAMQIDEAVNYWKERDTWASVVSVTPVHKKALRYERANGWLRELAAPGFRRQAESDDWDAVPDTYISNGAIQVTRVESLRRATTFWLPKSLPYVMNGITGLDIDEPWQLEIADALLRAWHSHGRLNIA